MLDRGAGVLGPTGTGGDDEVRRRERLGLVQLDRVVAEHDHLRAELLEQVREVVREASRSCRRAGRVMRPRASASVDRRLERRELAQALLVLGGRVRVGDDPGAGLEQRDAVGEHDRADRDARVERAAGSA